MDQDQFIEQYVTTFLATWTAKEYDSACANGQQKRLQKPPVEDAIYLARHAWYEMLAHNFPSQTWTPGR